MKKIIKFFKKFYREILYSIAFYPVLISILFVLFALLALSLEDLEIVRSFKESVPYLFIQDYETARSILSIFIGGIISLTVFSFSMVMLVLSQASTNFSPRLLPGLISNSRHQIILGTYTGTLLYCIIILTSLGARGIDGDTMGFSTMLAALFTVVCIGLFVYFIHNISGAIQVHNIINRIFENCHAYADKELKELSDSVMALSSLETSEWHVIYSTKTGYFGGFDQDLLQKSMLEENNQIEIVPYLNQHLWAGMPVLRTKQEISEDQLKNLMICINIMPDRHEDDKGIANMITLMEIAVRAMSPGINDPGTAIEAITKLGQLLKKFLEFPNLSSRTLKQDKLILVKNYIPARELIRIVVQPIRLYCKHDPSLMHVLIGALKFIQGDGNLPEDSRNAVAEELNLLEADLENAVENKADLQNLLHILNEKTEDRLKP